VAVAANVWPNDGQEGNANAEAAFGRLAVSTVNEREPIRKADGGSPDFDASERRNDEGEKEERALFFWRGRRTRLSRAGKKREVCFCERETRVEFLRESRTSTRPCSFHRGFMRQRALRSDIGSLLLSSTRLSSFSKLKEAEGLGGRERRRRSHSTSEGA
jgi:hypothetical protein